MTFWIFQRRYSSRDFIYLHFHSILLDQASLPASKYLFNSDLPTFSSPSFAFTNENHNGVHSVGRRWNLVFHMLLSTCMSIHQCLIPLENSERLFHFATASFHFYLRIPATFLNSSTSSLQLLLLLLLLFQLLSLQ